MATSVVPRYNGDYELIRYLTFLDLDAKQAVCSQSGLRQKLKCGRRAAERHSRTDWQRSLFRVSYL